MVSAMMSVVPPKIAQTEDYGVFQSSINPIGFGVIVDSIILISSGSFSFYLTSECLKFPLKL